MQLTFVVSAVLLGACVGATEKLGLLEDSRELENVSQLYKRKGLADKHCEVNKTVYWNGDKVQQYDSSVHECITCECSQGQLKYCTIADCPDISKCSGDSYTPEGQCCPICKRRSCGPGRKPEDRWFWWRREAKECFYCRCLLGDRADCRKASPPYCHSCYTPSIPRNPCCEACLHPTPTEITFPIQSTLPRGHKRRMREIPRKKRVLKEGKDISIPQSV